MQPRTSLVCVTRTPSGEVWRSAASSARLRWTRRGDLLVSLVGNPTDELVDKIVLRVDSTSPEGAAFQLFVDASEVRSTVALGAVLCRLARSVGPRAELHVLGAFDGAHDLDVVRHDHPGSFGDAVAACHLEGLPS